MKAHIVGGGFGGLAAAALLIRNAQVSGQDISIYEADKELGGGFFLDGSPQSGYNLPGSVFDKEFRCTFDLLATIPSASDPAVSVKDEFFAFNERDPFDDRAHIIDRDGQVVPHGPRFGLTFRDFFDLAHIGLTPEALLEGRRIDEFFSQEFFSTEFWLLWSTIMGSLKQHSAIEFRRYMNRFLYLFPNLGHEEHPAHAVLPAPGVHRTVGGLAAPARRKGPDRRLRREYRLCAGARPHHRRPARH